MTATPAFQIDEALNGPQQVGYGELWRKGLAMIQALSGERWTDYNAHDPGVTILEQLCYALTEMVHKSGFPAADYLTGPDGRIDYEKQAIHLPEQILPCRPVTLDDFRKAIFDAVPEIEDVHLDPGRQQGPAGLYTIRVRLAAGSSKVPNAVDPEKVAEHVKAVYGENRNLCEDAAAVEIVQPAACRLKGHVEIDGHHDPAALLAQIYYRCARLIAPGISVTAYDTAIKQGCSLETLFTGPLIRCGHIGPQELETQNRPVTLSDIHSVIRSVEGVAGIHDLTLLDEAGTPIVDLPPLNTDRIVSLAIPAAGEKMGIRLVKKSKIYPVSPAAFRAGYNRLEFNARAYKNWHQDFGALYDRPPAEHRPLDAYTSVQHHFPPGYGINRDGVPLSAGPLRHAQARQLKGYLLFFDQIMADFNAQLSRIGRLFSTERDLPATYFHQALDERNVPHVCDLQAVREDPLDRRLTRLIRRYDDACDRRSRLLDVMLAMYGERFNQKYMRHFPHYGSASQIPQTIIENKIRLLKHLPAAGRDRGGGVNYRHMAWESRTLTGFELKVRILLGLPSLYSRPLTAALASHGLKLVSDKRFRQMLEGGLEIAHVDLREIKVAPTDKFHGVPPHDSTAQITPERLAQLNQNVMLLQRQVINATFFRQGLHPNNYQIGPLTSQGDFQVIFRPFEQEQWCYLATYADRVKAVRAANDFARLLLHLNRQSEGMHVIEHILLRPLTAPDHKGIEVPDDFYPFRISVLMPAWTARFHDPAFRRHAEDTIRVNRPAHVALHVHWLDYDRMHAFEMVYRRWLKAKSDHPDGSGDLDELSAQLIRMLSAFKPNNATPPAGGA